jgi:hypothetical protein
MSTDLCWLVFLLVGCLLWLDWAWHRHHQPAARCATGRSGYPATLSPTDTCHGRWTHQEALDGPGGADAPASTDAKRCALRAEGERSRTPQLPGRSH